MTEAEKLQELSQEIVNNIYAMVKQGLLEKTLKPEKDWYLRWEIRDFKYSDTGVTYSGSRGENLLKPVWYSAIRVIEQEIKNLDIYESALELIPKVSKLPMPPAYLLSRLALKLSEEILNSRVTDSSQLDLYATSFTNDLLYKEHEYKAELQLRGLVLRPDSIQLAHNAQLRKPVSRDLTREEPVWSNHRLIPLESPSAFLHAETRAKHGGDFARSEVSRDVALLRLFRVGAVQPIRYTITTDSILDDTGRITITADRLLGDDKYLIREEDVQILKTFWENMKRVELPSSAYPGEQKEPDEISIAYARYNDALEGGNIEKRISSAVMGLEALYLGGAPKEMGELGYRLRMRVGKLLSLIGYDSQQVCKALIDAYDIRSTYVHGSLIAPKGRRKLEKKYGNVKEFSIVIMDYLRASIVALLKRPTKTSFLKKIDDSFLDSTIGDEVKELLFMPYEKEQPCQKLKSPSSAAAAYTKSKA